MLVSLSFTFGRQGGKDKGLTKDLCDKYGSSNAAVTGSKIVLCKEAMKPLKQLSGEMRGRLTRITSEWDIDGVYLCKPVNVAKVIALRDEYWPQFAVLKAGHLLERYDNWKELTKTQLQGAYKEEEFPTKEKLAEVKWDMHIMALPESEALRRVKDIDETLMAELMKSNDARIKKGINEGMTSAYGKLMEPLQHMVDTLSKDKPKIYESLVTHVREVIAEIPGLNLTDDSQLAQFAAEAEAMLASIDADTLRESPVIRQEVATKAADILATFGAVGIRRFSIN